MKIYLTFFLLISTIYKINCQSQEIELLKNVFLSEKKLYQKVNLSNKLSEAFIDINLDSSFFYSRKAIFYAHKIKSDFGLAKSYKILSHLYSLNSNYQQSTDTALKAILLFKGKSSNLSLGYCYNKIGDNYKSLGLEKKALEYYYLSESSYKKTDSISTDKIWNLTNLSILYLSKSVYSEALERLRIAQKMAISSSEFYKPLGQIYTTMANLYGIQGDSENTMKYYNEALEVFKKQNDSTNIAVCKLNIVGSYVNTDKNDIALSILNSIPESNGNIDYSFYINLNKSEIFLNMKMYDKALSYNSDAFELIETTNNKAWNMLANLQSARIYDAIENKSQAIKILETALVETNSFSSLNYKTQILSKLSELYQYDKNYKKAHESLAEYITITDSISEKQKLNETEFLKTVFNEEKAKLTLENKESELLYLKEKDALTLMYNKFLIVSFLLLVLFSVVIFYKQRKLLFTQKKAKSLEKEKLEQKIEYSNQQILDLSLHIHEKNDLLINIKNKLKKVLFFDEKQKLYLSTVISSINHDIRLNKEKIELYTLVDENNVSFQQRLGEKYPELSTKEQKIIQLLRLELSSKQIASQLSLSIYSIDTYRSKIRNKMKIPKNIKLSSFIKNL